MDNVAALPQKRSGVTKRKKKKQKKQRTATKFDTPLYRFKSQALLDEAALLSCMAYVDLNPVRAGMATTPEASDLTAIQDRIEQRREGRQNNWLKSLQTQKKQQGIIPFALADYFELVDWAGREIRDGKCGAIASRVSSILHRLGIHPKEWLSTMRPHGNRFFFRIWATSVTVHVCRKNG